MTDKKYSMGFIEDIERLASWEWSGEDCQETSCIKCKGRSSDLYFGVTATAKHLSWSGLYAKCKGDGHMQLNEVQLTMALGIRERPGFKSHLSSLLTVLS